MKKFLSILFAFMMLLMLASCSANSTSDSNSTSVSISKKFNEDFSIRDGIKFGMTQDEITELEKSRLGDLSTHFIVDTKTLSVYYKNILDLYNKYHVIEVRTKVLDANSQRIYYHFDDDYKLIDFGYELYSGFTYDGLLKQLKNKYGNPVNNDMAYYIWLSDCSPLITTIPLDNDPRNLAINKNYMYWIVEYNDGVVLIELNDGVNKENKFVGDYDVCFIGYRLTTKEKLEQSIKETKEGIEKRKKEKEDAVKTDI